MNKFSCPLNHVQPPLTAPFSSTALSCASVCTFILAFSRVCFSCVSLHFVCLCVFILVFSLVCFPCASVRFMRRRVSLCWSCVAIGPYYISFRPIFWHFRVIPICILQRFPLTVSLLCCLLFLDSVEQCCTILIRFGHFPFF